MVYGVLWQFGAGVLLLVVVFFLVWVTVLVWVVLTKSVPGPGSRDVSVTVRPFPWPRVEIVVTTPRDDVPAEPSPDIPRPNT